MQALSPTMQRRALLQQQQQRLQQRRIGSGGSGAAAARAPLLRAAPSQRRQVQLPRSTGSAAGDAGKQAGDAISGALGAAAKQADALKQGAAAAAADATGALAGARDALLGAAKDALLGVDALVGDLDASFAAVKRDAGGSSKAAGVAMDNMVTAAIAKGALLKEKLGGSSPEAAARLDAVMTKFVARANELRAQLGSQQVGAGRALDETLAAVREFSADAKDAVLAAAAAGSGLSLGDLRAALSLPASTSSSGASSSGSGGSGLVAAVKPWLQLWATLASLYYADKAIKVAFVELGVKFPSALAGMFGVFALLCAVGDGAADRVLAAYAPALNWIARWLPLFYVPALVTLPLSLTGIPTKEVLMIVGILAVGMVATLLFTAQVTVVIREAVKTPVKEIAKAKPSAPFLASHYGAWGGIAAAALAATLAGAPDLGARMALPFGLACTVGGYLIGELVPKQYHGVLHPVVVTAVIANVGAALHGQLLGWSYAKAQQVYLAKGAGPLGAGDALMGLLGIVIISFGFRIYTQRDTMKRHFPEIFGATVLSSVFSLFSTAFAAKALGLSSALARALIPRSVTVALALPIAQNLEAPLAITAAAVLLQGILGANFGPGLMTAVGIKDTIARGLAAAGTAGGLGTASLTSKEPEALPFCALSYALVGIFSTVITSVPAVRDLLIAIVG